MAAHLDEVPRLAGALHRPAAPLLAQLQANPNKRFLYLERGLSPIEASEVMALGITGYTRSRNTSVSTPVPS